MLYIFNVVSVLVEAQIIYFGPFTWTLTGHKLICFGAVGIAMQDGSLGINKKKKQ